MNPETIQSLCIAGTDAYLNFLVEHNRGVERIEVTKLERLQDTPQQRQADQEKPLFKVELAGPLFDPDCVSLELKPPLRIHGPENFRVVKYDGEKKVLIIQVQKPELSLDGRSAESVRVISDVRFLVRNVKRWFVSNGSKLQLPSHMSRGRESPVVGWSQRHSIPLESCQIKGVAASFEHALTYVWGPPGTGKTRHVLTAAVLEIVLAGGRVGLFAPTNNALEQAMTAILKAGEAAGVDRGRFLRVGHPSATFAESFPEVCEMQGLERQLRLLREQIEVYTTVLTHRRGATVLNSAATLRHETAKLQDLLHERRGLCEELGRVRRNPLSKVVHLLDGSLRSVNNKLTALENEIDGQLELIRRTRTESQPLNAIIERINFINVDQIETEVIGLESATRQYLEVNRALAEAYEGQTDEEIQELKTEREQELKALESQTILERIKSASLIGMTLDCFIGRFHETSLPFDHIFLDEAGYAPLVKALTLCRAGIPLTFVGDHKQLGPVCEMNDENLTIVDNTPAVVWRKSALFLDEIFLTDSQDNFVARLFAMSEPECKSFSRTTLNKTFRFGQRLADILSNYVYPDVGLTAVSPHGDLDIVCVDAIPIGSDARLRRTSPAEAQCIASYIREHPELDMDDEATFAILTPYKRQVRLLGDILREARRRGRIMTVHKAQGREWHTVFFSVVDGRLDRPWFTDTTNPQSGGLYVVNTAVSRARKRLVIVCDMDYWSRRGANRQLISKLLNATG